MGTRRHTPSISASGLSPPHSRTLSCPLYQQSCLHPLPSPMGYSQSTLSSKLFRLAPRPSFQLQVLLYLFIFLQLAQSTHLPAPTTTQISTTSISSSNGSSRLQNPIQVPNPTTPRPTTLPAAAIPSPASQIDPTEEENSNKAATTTPWTHKDSTRKSLNKNSTASSAYHLENNLTRSAFPDLLVGGIIPACGLKCIVDHLAPGAGDCLLILGQQQQRERDQDQPRQRSGGAAADLDGSEQRQKDCLCAAASATTSSGQDDDDLGFYPAVLTCVEASCNMEEAIGLCFFPLSLLPSTPA
ncbi:hypothetical protein QBC37DRAFT_175272 [Rhypophila decipiens]|uniref:Uncharacterized protein n=1 Tax=Rhypophila decipiens TaxID=261697 RepID=A0AAN6Y6R4_9PEZI|nr:hypothetical protein QBC37DRAFT_175272 [Rhypophila decipiens]